MPIGQTDELRLKLIDKPSGEMRLIHKVIHGRRHPSIGGDPPDERIDGGREAFELIDEYLRGNRNVIVKTAQSSPRQVSLQKFSLHLQQVPKRLRYRYQILNLFAAR